MQMGLLNRSLSLENEPNTIKSNKLTSFASFTLLQHVIPRINQPIKHHLILNHHSAIREYLSVFILCAIAQLL